MMEYSKINTIWKRDLKHNIQLGEFSSPVFEYLKDNIWVFTEKVDGTNIRINLTDGKVRFGGRTARASIHAGLLNYLRETFTEEKMESVFNIADTGAEVTLYGEGYGANIQAGGENYRYDGQGFCLFDILCGRWWLEREALEDVAAKLNIGIVPIVGEGTLAYGQDIVISGILSAWGNFKAEGLVGKPKIEMLARSGERIIVKMKTKDYSNFVVTEKS